MSHNDNLIYISMISLVVSIVSSIITFLITWTISNFYNRKNKIIDEINFYLSLINSRTNKFNQRRFLKDGGQKITFKLVKLDNQFPILFTFLRNMMINKNSLNNISRSISVSLLNLKIIRNIFKELDNKFSKIISYIAENYINNNSNFGETLSEYKLKKDIAKNNQVSVDQISMNFNRKIKIYLRFDKNQINSSFTQSFSFDIQLDGNRNKYKTKASNFFTNLEIDIKNINHLFVIRYCDLNDLNNAYKITEIKN